MQQETEGTAIKPGTPASEQATGAEPSRHVYVRPRLEVLGDLRDLTLGGSPNTGDSGDPLNTEPPGT